MASSINASLSAGVITTADTSGVLNIQTAGTTAISIDASQAVSFTNSPTVTGGTANGVAYLNGSKVLTTGSVLTFDGAILGVNGVSVGRGAGAVSTNTAVGASALAANTSGSTNTGVGYQAGKALTTGGDNTAIGQALVTATTGGSNIAVGNGSLYSTTTAGNNVAVGVGAAFSNTTGQYNIAVGTSALSANTTASNNTAVGYQAGYASTGTAQVFVGRQAGYGNTGSYNTAVGELALYTSGSSINNVAVGQGALYLNTSGSQNTALGMNALLNNSTASNNTAVGYQAGYSGTTGIENVFLGSQAGYSSTTASGSVYVGYYSGQATTGLGNTFIGNGSGYLVTSGTKNTILGKYNGNAGGLDIRTSSNYIVLSDGDGNPRVYSYPSSNASIFVLQGQSATTYGLIASRNSSGTDAGYLAMGQANGPGSTYDHVWALSNNTGARMYVQNISAGVYLAQGGTSWTSNSDERLKTDLQPIENAAQKVSTLRAVTGRFKTDDENVSRAFLIAQDVQAVLPQAVDASDPEKIGVQYTDVIPLLVAAIKELKAEVDSLKSQLNQGA